MRIIITESSYDDDEIHLWVKGLKGLVLLVIMILMVVDVVVVVRSSGCTSSSPNLIGMGGVLQVVVVVVVVVVVSLQRDINMMILGIMEYGIYNLYISYIYIYTSTREHIYIT